MQKNTVIFIVASLLIFIGWMLFQRWLNPPQPLKPKPPAAEVKKEEKPKPSPVDPKQPPALAAPAAPRKHQFITLGGEGFYLRLVLDPRGGGVRQIVCCQTDDRGRPVFEKADGMGRPVPNEMLELVPEDRNREEPSNLLYHYTSGDPERPLDTLGKVEWTPQIIEPGRRVAFVYDRLPDVVLTKTFSLEPGDYHVGLDIKVERKVVPDAALPALRAVPLSDAWTFLAQQAALASKLTSDPVPFQYQLTSAHGLPIEGKWYTSTFRNALVGLEDQHGYLWRDMQDLRTISRKLGGEPVKREDGKFIRYAGVAVQYFASVLVVSDDQATHDILARAQATIESAVLRGKIRAIAPDASRLEVLSTDKIVQQFFVPRWDTPLRIKLLSANAGQDVLVRYRLEDAGNVAMEIYPGDEAEQLLFDDISVRVVSKPFEVKVGAPVTHKYLLYNGPVKVRLLADKGVPSATVDKYNDTLKLNTLTDYHSNGWFGEFASKIYWSELLIKCTNLMHGVLSFLHHYIMPWSWGLCIVMLTVLVRGMMFPLSRKQALTTMRMQALAPEIKKIQEKYKDDRQALGMAQMDLYRKHGINPLGSCWLLLLQMPIFLGLYYCLQESIDFRLSEFLWIKNLAAPDMLIYWGQSIPWVSKPSDYGSMLLFIPTYLGPYLNLLPVLAVGLMIAQQSLLMPPAMDDQQRMQQKMMKWMMIIFGLLFYKVAAGLCIYFIASSLWGFAERKLLPKKKTDAPLPEVKPRKPGLFQRALQQLDAQRQQQQGNGAAVSTSQPVTPAQASSKRKKRKQGRDRQQTPGAPATAPEPQTWWDGVRAWWAEVRRKAEKR